MPCYCSSCGPWPTYENRVNTHHPNCPSSDAAESERARNTDALERARVVAVLDGWAADRERDEGPESASHTTERPTNPNNGEWVTILFSGYEGDEDTHRFRGPTPDAARAAAAKAIEAHEV